MNNQYLNGSHFTQRGYEYAKNELENGRTYTSLAKDFGITGGHLARLCKKVGIDKDNRRKYYLNENYFDKIDSCDKAYWLGFLMADGCIAPGRNRLQVYLQRSDKNALIKFARCLSSNYPVRDCIVLFT